MKKLITENQNAFTIVELIIYIAIVSIFITGAVLFTFDILYGREKAYQSQVVDQSARLALARVGYQIRRAQRVDSFTANTLVLEEEDSTLTTIAQNGNALEITFDTDGPYTLTSNQINVTNFTVTNLTTSNQNSSNIKIELTVEQAQEPTRGQVRANTTVSTSVELNSQFNLARQLLIDLSGATLTGSNRVTNIKLRNTGEDDMNITDLIISWTAGGNLTEVQIAGGDVEWTGLAPSGTQIDIIDFYLEGLSTQTPINNMQFTESIEGATILVTFILSDGSSTTGSFTLPGGTGGPSGSCLSECQGAGYTTAICERKPQDCNVQYLPSGDQFCTQNPYDTCCCE